MWTIFWGLLTLALFALTLARTPGDVNALLFVLALTMAGVFGFSLSLTIARRRQERERKGSQPLR